MSIFDRFPFTLTSSVKRKRSPSPPSSPPSPPTPPDANPGPCVRDIGPIIKSPFDTKRYKAIQLENGVKAVIVSTCVHDESDEPKPKKCTSCSTKNKINYFNRKIAGNSSLSQEPRNNNDDLCSACQLQIIPPKSSSARVADGTPQPPPKKRVRVLRCCGGDATCCITVGAGSFHESVSGLAHLLEHSVFLGSKEYPEPNQLFLEVYGNDGILNATTAAEQTSFFFTGRTEKPGKFELCLNILLNGITHPLLNPESIKKEVAAVDSEFGIKQTCDYTRMSDFLRSRAKNKHPMRNFYWGNKDTLNHPLLTEILSCFHKRYYVPANITVCIQAPVPLESIEDMVIRQFSSIPGGSTTGPTPTQEILAWGAPFSSESFFTSYYITPVSHLTCLQISWCLPPDLWRDHEAHPLQFASTLISNRSAGGLVRFLKQKHWTCCSLNVNAACHPDNFCRNSFCSMFTISIYLTDKGYRERAMVILAVFSYLKMVRGARPHDIGRCFMEMQLTALHDFHFFDWEEILQSTKDIAEALQIFPPEHVLTADKFMTTFCYQKVKRCLDLLTPRTANFIFVSTTNAAISKDTAWPGKIPYGKEGISSDFYQLMDSVKVCPEFKMPPVDSFKAKEIAFDMPADMISKREIFESDKLNIQYMGDMSLPCSPPRIPSGTVTVLLASPAAADSSRIKTGILELWKRIIIDHFVEQAEYKYEPLFVIELDNYREGLLFSVRGPRCHLAELLMLVIRLTLPGGGDCLGISETYFEDRKLELLREYTNDIYEVEILSSDLFEFILTSSHESIFQKRSALKDVGYQEFIRLLQLYKKQMKISVGLEGTLIKEDISRITTLFQRLQYSSPGFIAILDDRSSIIPYGTSILCVEAVHPAFVNSVVTNYYQFEEKNAKTFEYFRLLFHAMKRRIPTQLRTVEQLGYTVYIRPVHDLDTLGYKVIVVAKRKDFAVDEVDQRIDSFFQAFYENNLKNEKSIANTFKRYSHNLSTPADLRDIKRFFADHMLETGKKFRKLSIQVMGHMPNYKMNKVERSKIMDCTGSDNDDAGDDVVQLSYRLGQDEPPSGTSHGVRFIRNLNEFKGSLMFAPASEEDAP